MKVIDDIPSNAVIACMSNKNNPVTETCPLEDVCGFNGFSENGTKPDQWFR
jgi:hypothetical protein